MRRDGVVTGYLWGKNMFGKVKVKGKPSNASKASARCRRTKCSLCHHQPVSKARSKTKGRNKCPLRRLLDAADEWTFSKFAPTRPVKAGLSVPSHVDYDQPQLSKAKSKSKGRTKRALSRLLVDDEQAFCKRAPAHRVMAVLSFPWTHVDYDDSYTCDALDTCYSDVKVAGHDVDDGASDVYDGCHAEANPVGCEVNDGEHDTEEENDDHEINVADDVSADAGIHSHDDVKEVATLTCDAAAHNGDNEMCSYQSFGSNGSLGTATYPIHIVRAENLKKVASDVNPGICKKANDVIIDGDGDDDVNHGSCHATATHAKIDVAPLKEDEDNEDGANDTNASEESHALTVHVIKDHVSDEDGIYSDGDTNDFRSLISNLVRMEWPIHDNKEEVLEVESKEEDSLGDDWCYVASSDAIDDWYFC